MLHDVVWGDHGTARKFLQDDKVEIAGKTGTAFEVIKGQYGGQKRLAFCGFFPYEHPKYSCIVLMRNANVGAAACSGMVLKNIALKMYAIGLLGDAPDYTAKSESVQDYPVLYASMNDYSYNNIMQHLKTGGKPHRYARPKEAAKGVVPNVVGLNVREAIMMLEDAGLSVTFTGSGMVISQSVTAGSQYTAGQKINLTLRNS